MDKNLITVTSPLLPSLDDFTTELKKIWESKRITNNGDYHKELEKELDILKIQHQGSLLLITARGTRSEIMAKIQSKKPLFCEVIPLTLEEIFISETEVAGYEIKNLF